MVEVCAFPEFRFTFTSFRVIACQERVAVQQGEVDVAKKKVVTAEEALASVVGDEKAEKMLDRAITAQKNAEDILAKKEEGVRAAAERFDKQCEQKPMWYHQTGTFPIAGIVGVFGTAVLAALLIKL